MHTKSLNQPTTFTTYIAELRTTEYISERPMGEWKAPLSLRIRRELRADLESFATRERRTLGNVGELILEWGLEQLKIAGSTDRLLKSKISLPAARQTRRGSRG